MIGEKSFMIEKLANGKSRVSGNCVFTGEPYECTVSTIGLEMWHSGTPIAWALPNSSRDDREFLISGISPAGWKKVFGE